MLVVLIAIFAINAHAQNNNSVSYNEYGTINRIGFEKGYIRSSQEFFNRCVHGVQSAYDNGTSIQYTQALLQVIYSSELSDDMKSCLMGSIVVTNASCRLWNEDAYGSVQVEDM